MDVKQTSRQHHVRLVDSARETASPLRLPPEGWLRTVRKALGMSGAQLARRLGVSRARITNLEQAERKGAVTIKSMEAAAEAMGCRFIYAVVPVQSVEDAVRQQAERKANAIVRRASTHMALEMQGLPADERAHQALALARELARDMPSDLWDDEA